MISVTRSGHPFKECFACCGGDDVCHVSATRVSDDRLSTSTGFALCSLCRLLLRESLTDIDSSPTTIAVETEYDDD